MDPSLSNSNEPRPAVTLDPRIEAVVIALAELEGTVPDLPMAAQTRDLVVTAYGDDARYLLAAADAVDPLRVSLPPNPRQTRAGIAPAGTPTKRIWPEP